MRMLIYLIVIISFGCVKGITKTKEYSQAVADVKFIEGGGQLERITTDEILKHAPFRYGGQTFNLDDRTVAGVKSVDSHKKYIFLFYKKIKEYTIICNSDWTVESVKFETW